MLSWEEEDREYNKIEELINCAFDLDLILRNNEIFNNSLDCTEVHLMNLSH